MENRRTPLVSLLVAQGLAIASSVACSDEATPSPGTGGTAPNAGGTMGASGAGGTAAGGGSTTGGASGAATGGLAGSLAGSSGAAGSGGASAGQGGSGGSSGSAAGSSGAGRAGAAGEIGGGGSSGAMAGQGGSGGDAAGAAGSAGALGGAGAGGNAGEGAMTKSAGCGQERTLEDGNRMVQSNGTNRSYVLRVPTDYDNERPYRLILGFHGANGKGADIAPTYFGLWSLSEGSTIFAAPDAVNGLWNATADTAMVSALVEQLSNDLCIDTSRIELEGFSQGGAMVWTLACALPGKFRLAIVHSGGGLPMPQSCEPIPFFSTLGTDGSGQDMSSDFFAMTNGCTVETLPAAPTGGHTCTNYEDCDAGFPTRWCDYDAGHTPAPVDSGQNSSWVPQEVWTFVEQF